MVEEMLKLRKLLTEQEIEWHDCSEPPEYPLRIDRTHFDYNGFSWSVVNGFGTYGGYNSHFNKKNQGLLELMSAAVGEGEPVGYLTADDAMRLILEGENEQDS